MAFVMQLGDSWEEVRQLSPARLPTPQSPAGVLYEGPITLQYRDPRHPLNLDGWYFGATFKYETGEIIEITLGVGRGTSDVESTYQRLHDLHSVMEAAGWKPDNERNQRLRSDWSLSTFNSKWRSYPNGGQGEWEEWYDDHGHIAYSVVAKTLGNQSEPHLNVVLHIAVASWPSRRAKEQPR